MAVVVHTSVLPVLVTPRAPAGEQVAPGCMPWRIDGFVVLVVVRGVGLAPGSGVVCLPLGTGPSLAGTACVGVAGGAPASVESLGVGSTTGSLNPCCGPPAPPAGPIESGPASHTIPPTTHRPASAARTSRMTRAGGASR